MATITKEQIRKLVRRVLLEQEAEPAVVADEQGRPNPPAPPPPADPAPSAAPRRPAPKLPEPPPPAPPPAPPPEPPEMPEMPEVETPLTGAAAPPALTDVGLGKRDEEGMLRRAERIAAMKAASRRGVGNRDDRPFSSMASAARGLSESGPASAETVAVGSGEPTSYVDSRKFRELRRGESRAAEEQIQEKRRTKDRMAGRPKGSGREKVSESIFAPNHYCIHHGGVSLNGKVYMAEAVNHNYDPQLGRVTHYDMRFSNGLVLENVPAEYIQVTKASLSEEHSHPVAKRDEEDEEKSLEKELEEGSGDRNDKDREDGHGNQRYKAGTDGKPGELEEGSGDRNDKDREQGHGKQRQRAGSDGKKGELEEATGASEGAKESGGAFAKGVQGVKKGAKAYADLGRKVGGAMRQGAKNLGQGVIEDPIKVPSGAGAGLFEHEEAQEASDKEWYNSQLFEALKKKWTV